MEFPVSYLGFRHDDVLLVIEHNGPASHASVRRFFFHRNRAFSRCFLRHSVQRDAEFAFPRSFQQITHRP